ncbi:hypothetical protein Y614_23780 [Salmonella enterica subsp. enterica serovar Montevideo]|nr:hypothetical protein [Salmonella enterica subsp. enterica serovar Montevideo]
MNGLLQGKVTVSHSRSCDLSYQWLLPVAFLRVFPGWTQVNSYRIRRSSRAERGVLAYSPAWSERPTPNRDTRV